jgi:hypothetical protein
MRLVSACESAGGVRDEMLGFATLHNLDTENCDRRWTVSGWAVSSRVAGLLRLLDDSFSLPGIQSVYRYA